MAVRPAVVRRVLGCRMVHFCTAGLSPLNRIELGRTSLKLAEPTVQDYCSSCRSLAWHPALHRPAQQGAALCSKCVPSLHASLFSPGLDICTLQGGLQRRWSYAGSAGSRGGPPRWGVAATSAPPPWAPQPPPQMPRTPRTSWPTSWPIRWTLMTHPAHLTATLARLASYRTNVWC